MWGEVAFSSQASPRYYHSFQASDQRASRTPPERGLYSRALANEGNIKVESSQGFWQVAKFVSLTLPRQSIRRATLGKYEAHSTGLEAIPIFNGVGGFFPVLRSP